MSRTDYIFGTGRRLFQKFSARELWHNTDHYLVQGCLCQVNQRENKCSFGMGMQILFHLTKRTSREENIFASLQQELPNKTARKCAQNSLVLEEPCYLYILFQFL